MEVEVEVRVNMDELFKNSGQIISHKDGREKRRRMRDVITRWEEGEESSQEGVYRGSAIHAPSFSFLCLADSDFQRPLS